MRVLIVLIVGLALTGITFPGTTLRKNQWKLASEMSPTRMVR